MKTAIYIVEGTVQIVLTPENEHEKNVVGLIDQPNKVLKVLRGSFYETKGGWYRQEEQSDQSLILRIDDAPKDYEQAAPGEL